MVAAARSRFKTLFAKKPAMRAFLFSPSHSDESRNPAACALARKRERVGVRGNGESGTVLFRL